MSVPRSSTVELERRHCPAAAIHQDIGTPRDIEPMAVGTVVHHLIHAVATRDPETLAADTIDATAASLVANGRSFEGQPKEFPTLEEANIGRALALDFLDRDEIPEGDLHAERSVDLGGAWQVVERGKPAIWRQALDLFRTYREEIDEQELLVAEVTDWKGWLPGEGWMVGLQGMGAAASAVAICPEADVVRRRIVSYQPRGRAWSTDLYLNDHEDLDTLQEYRQALLVASKAHRARQGKSPDEVARPGAGCSAGFGGCPFLAHCKPALEAWHGSVARYLRRAGSDTPAAAASQWAIAEAIKQETGKIVKKALVDSAGVEVEGRDNRFFVGWKKTGGSKVDDNAAKWLAEAWAEVAMALPKGSPEAQAAATTVEGLLRVPKALGVSTVRALVKRLGDLLEPEECEALEARCLSDSPGRKLATWKAPAKNYDNAPDKLADDLKASLK